MLPARVHVVVVILAATAALLLAAPLAGAHDASTSVADVPLGPPAPLASSPDAIAARDAFEQAVFEREVELTPVESSDGSCDETRRIDGIGAACRTDDGMLRVLLPGGGEMFTHGPDFMNAATDLDPSATAPHIVAAVRSATKQSVACVGASSAHTQLVFAFPADGVDRSAGAQLQAFRQATYEASAVIDNTSRMLSPTAGRRLRVSCDGNGEANVAVLRLRHTTAAATFATVRQDIQAQLGDDDASPVRYLVYYDADLDTYSGIGSFYWDEASGDANDNNSNLATALQDDSYGTGPRWDVLLHEITHNMGAVLKNAPDSNGVGHCNDGLDVMCYQEDGSDGNLTPYVADACEQLQYDCGADTYFNPAPAGGSWLATHWNAASTANRFLEAQTVTPDTSAPAQVTGVTGTGHGTFYRVDWDPVGDDDVLAYRVEYSGDGGTTWGAAGDSWPGASAVDVSWSGISAYSSWTLRVRAYDELGNLGTASAPVTVARGASDSEQQAIDGPEFDDPADVVVSSTTSTTATIRWAAPQQNADWIQVDRWNGSSWTYMDWAYADDASITVTASPSWRLRVRAADSSGRTSPGVALVVDRNAAAPEAPGATQVTASDGAVPTVSWSAVAGAAGYSVTTSPTTKTTYVTSTNAQLPSFAFGTSYTISVRALASGGAASGPTTTSFTAPVAPDTTAPTRPSIASCPSSGRTKTSLPLTWTPGGGTTSQSIFAAPATRPWDYVRSAALAANATSGSVGGLRPGTAYYVSVAARDAAGNSSSAIAYCSLTTLADTTLPATPATAFATATGAHSIRVAWSASSDDSAVEFYRIRRASPAPAALLATVPASDLQWDATGLDASTSYSFTVEAVDLAGNVSGTRSASATTPSDDVVPPSAPGAVTVDAVTASTATLSWIAATDDVGVTGYEVRRGTASGTVLATSPNASATVTSLADATTHTFAVVAMDAAGNRSATASIAVATTLDGTAPAVPGALAATSIAANGFDASWGAPTDNVAVAGYDVQLDGAVVASPTSTGWHASGLAEATTYLVRVRAKDAAGNVSAWSSPLLVATLDATAPGAPPNLRAEAADVRATLAWDSSTDNLAVAGYRVYDVTSGTPVLRSGAAPITDREFVLDALTPSTAYVYRVTAVDAAGNESAPSDIPVTTAALPDTTAPYSPTGLTASLVTTGSLHLSWSAVPIDPSGVSYRVERQVAAGTWAAVTTTTDVGVDVSALAAGTTYTFAVRAFDGAGNESTRVTVQTTTAQLPDTTAPSLPGDLRAQVDESGIVDLSWGAASDNRGVAEYVVSRDIGAGWMTAATTTLLGVHLTGQPVGATMRYAVAARDAAGNTGSMRTLTVSIPAPPTQDDGDEDGDDGGGDDTPVTTRDTTAPTMPRALRVRATRGGKLVVSWSRSTDAGGLARYELRLTAPRQRAKSLRVPAARATATIAGLKRGVRWTIQARAVDAAGNASRWATTRAVTRR